MTLFTHEGRLIVASAMLVPAMVSLWLMAVPGIVTPSTYATIAALMLALAAIVLNTYKSAQAPGSMGHVLYQTELATASSGRAAGTSDVAGSGF